MGLEAVIHVELDRVRRHSQPGDVLVLKVDIRIDQVVTEHAASFQELPIAM